MAWKLMENDDRNIIMLEPYLSDSELDVFQKILNLQNKKIIILTIEATN